jgi:uncharacterized protein (TIGR03067 family)
MPNDMKTIALLSIAFVLIGAAATSGEEKISADRLVGSWTCVRATVNGKPLSESAVKKLRLTLTEKRYKTERKDEVLFDSTYRLDTEATPTRITMVGTEGELAGKEAQGILSLTKDILTICYTTPGKARPLEFQSTEGSEAHLVVWKRDSRRQH